MCFILSWLVSVRFSCSALAWKVQIKNVWTDVITCQTNTIQAPVSLSPSPVHSHLLRLSTDCNCQTICKKIISVSWASVSGNMTLVGLKAPSKNVAQNTVLEEAWLINLWERLSCLLTDFLRIMKGRSKWLEVDNVIACNGPARILNSNLQERKT